MEHSSVQRVPGPLSIHPVHPAVWQLIILDTTAHRRSDARTVYFALVGHQGVVCDGAGGADVRVASLDDDLPRYCHARATRELRAREGVFKNTGGVRLSLSDL